MLRRQHKLLIDAVLLGVVGRITAVAAGGQGLWLIPLFTTLGGSLAGVLVYSLAPEAEGHGTDTVGNAFHNLRGMIRESVPFVRMAASVINDWVWFGRARGSNRADQCRHRFDLCNKAQPLRG